MDPSKFDDLTKAIATSTSRRQALKTIAATTLGSILGLGGIGTAFADPKPPKKCHNNGLGCSRNDQCCPGLICDQTTGTCACPSGQTECNGTCKDLSSDNNNCGSCGNVCPPSQVCSGGVCGCPPGTTKLCNGSCAHFCGNCSSNCVGCVAASNGAVYCAQNGSGKFCGSDCDCPTGEFCINGGECTGVC